MTLKLNNMRMATKSEWDRVWSGCEYATYFQSREWSEIWQCHSGGDYLPSPYLMEFSDNSRAIFPMTWYCSGGRYLASPAGTYGGLISLQPIDGCHLASAIIAVQQKLGTLAIRFNAITPVEKLSPENLALHDDTTEMLFLESGFEAVYLNWSHRHKRAVRKARDAGVTVRPAVSAQDWQDYFEIYRSSIQRWGGTVSSSYDWSFFENVLLRDSRNVRLWLSCYQGQPVAGALCFYAKKHAVYWHGAALSDYFHLRPVQLLFYEVIRAAAANGYHWFDFNPSGGHESVRAFKQGFGTVSLPCPWLDLLGKDRPAGVKRKCADLRLRAARFLYERGL